MKKVIVLLVIILVLLAFALGCYYGAKILNNKQESQENDGDFFNYYYQQKCNSYTFQNINLSKGQIVFIGDSITDSYKLDDHYSDLPLAVYNRGIGGDATDGVLDRLQVSLFDIEPSKIVIMIGINDLNWGRSNEFVIEHYEKILSSIKDNLPDSEVFVMSILPENKLLEQSSTVDVDKNNENIKKLNIQIKSLAESLDYTYVDLFSLTVDDNGYLRSDYSDDGLHLNNRGYEVWTSLLKPYLENK